MSDWKRANTDWMKDAKYGIFCHYLADSAALQMNVTGSADDWNAQVDSFDVERFAKEANDTGAKYVCITLGQNSGFYCSPNSTYDSIVGLPSKLSKRDLVKDLYTELALYGIKTMVYLPSGAPCRDTNAMEKLRYQPEFDPRPLGVRIGSYSTDPNNPCDDRLSEFQRNWEAVISEWSTRWGKNVCGWWIDGVYLPEQLYGNSDEPNFKSFAKAMKAGNPDSVVAFNFGVKPKIMSITPYEDYTAGEADGLIADYLYGPMERFTKANDTFEEAMERGKNNTHIEEGAQLQILSYLGKCWGFGEPRFPDALVKAYTDYINSLGGCVTWDVPISKDGKIPDQFLKQLKCLKS